MLVDGRLAQIPILPTSSKSRQIDQYISANLSNFYQLICPISISGFTHLVSFLQQQEQTPLTCKWTT